MLIKKTNFLFLYKRILRLHRALPPEAKIIGDLYVKEEFRRHKDADPEQAKIFFREWSEYAVTLAKQVGPQGIRLSSAIGKNLTENDLSMLAEDQLVQLYELYNAALKLKTTSDTSSS